MNDRLNKLYGELEYFLNNSPYVGDCSDEENQMYSDMADLKISIENLKDSMIDNKQAQKECGFDYGRACHESALKAFNSLLEDGHSIASIKLTRDILNRLIDGKCLTPIEDTDDIWGCIHESNLKEGKKYQCTRMGSLFKKVKPDGTVTYRDVSGLVVAGIAYLTITSFKNGSKAFEIAELNTLKDLDLIKDEKVG